MNKGILTGEVCDDVRNIVKQSQGHVLM